MSNLVKAKLIKRITDDECFEVFDDVPIGKEYIVDLDTIAKVGGYNVKKDVWWYREIIYTNEKRYFPVELLEIEGR